MSETARHTLAFSQGFAQVDALHAALLDLLEVEGPVELDGSEVEYLDTSSLQVLAVFVRDRKAAGRAVTWCTPSRSLVRHAALAGLSGHLGLPEGRP